MESLLEVVESCTLKAQLQFSLAEIIAETKHNKCHQIMLNYMKDSIKPGEEIYRSVVEAELGAKAQPFYGELLQVEGALAEGRYLEFLNFAVGNGCKLDAVKCLVEADAEQCSGEEISMAVREAAHIAVSVSREDILRFLIIRRGDLKSKKLARPHSTLRGSI